MEKIKTQKENPKGLHQRYYIQKIVKNPDYLVKVTDTFLGEDNTPEFITKPVDSDAEYFVLRLDKNGSDPKHIEACRKAVISYAINIEPYLPGLAKDLIERYGQPPNSDEEIHHLKEYCKYLERKIDALETKLIDPPVDGKAKGTGKRGQKTN